MLEEAKAVDIVDKMTLQKRIKSEKVLMFCKTTCPACDRSKALLKEKGVKYTNIMLDLIENGARI